MDWACHPWSPARSHPDRQFSLAVTPVSLGSPWKRDGAKRTGNTNPREGILSGFSNRCESDSLEANGRFAMRPGIALRGDDHAARLRMSMDMMIQGWS